MRPNAFWIRWMTVVAAAMVALGVVMAIAGGTGLLGFLNDRFDPTFWGDAPVPEPAVDYRAWLFAVLGGTMAGWSVAMIVLIRRGIAEGIRWAWTAVALGLAVWYPLDTGYSLGHHVWINAVGNTVILASMAVPLLIVRRSTR